MGFAIVSKTTSFGTPTREGHDSSSFYKRRMYAGAKKRGKAELQKENVPLQLDVIYRHDSRDMHHLPDNSVHLMVTSPPYNVGKDYDSDLNLEEYKELLEEVMAETYRVLVEGGRACINIANIGRSPYIPLHAYVVEIAQRCGFFMRGEVIWDKGASAGTSCAWGSWKSASNPTLRDVHEYILVFCKNTFKRRPIRQNTIGRDSFIECTKSIWRFNAESAKKVGHPAPFPVELPLRLIHFYSFAGDVVLDPFMGSGSTALACDRSDRNWIGYDSEPDYCRLTRARLINDRRDRAKKEEGSKEESSKEAPTKPKG